jgi:hypothetical protein
MFYGVDAKNPQDHALGKEVLEVLDQFYPGHSWYVFVGGGVLQIKNLSFSSKWGMVRKLKNIQHDAMVRKREIIRAAGEFLERANLKRGKREMGQKVTQVEGIPQRDMGR